MPDSGHPQSSSIDQRAETKIVQVSPSGSEQLTLNTLGSLPTATAISCPLQAGRYRILEEIGRGGMGEVFRVHDPDIGRTLALKVMLTRHDHAASKARFLEEARITGQLQHPGIPPVHEIGRLEDGRPFFAMKLIEGRTLHDLLKERTSPAHDLPRFIAIFGQLCQAVGYAHSRGVIHRDLKPANVMVGEFAEVQVMDWGLAKNVQAQNADSQEQLAERGSSTESSLQSTSRSGLHETQAGSVLGTPAFMPPEQARGQIELIDERADVFGLGAILCVVLTGQPPHQGRDGTTVLQSAAGGELASAFARLDASGADPELIALARSCLSADREHRPRTAGVVAARVESYLAGVQERLKQAEVQRARAEVQRAAERTRRRLTVALALVGLVVVGLVGLAAWLMERQHAEREQEAGRRAVAQARRMEQARLGVQAALEQATQLRQRFLFKEAEKALNDAEKLLEDDSADELREIRAARDDLRLVERLDRIRQDKMILIEGKLNETAASPAYAQAFREAGLDVLRGELKELAERIARSPIREELVAALDDWGFIKFDQPEGKRLLQLTTLVHPEQIWREAGIKLDEETLRQHVRKGNVSSQFLTGVCMWLGLKELELMREVCLDHPTDSWLHFFLANQLRKLNRLDEAIAHYHAACALRPDSPAILINLAAALQEKKDVDGALIACKKAIELQPRSALAHNNLGTALLAKKDLDGALAACKKAIEFDPQLAVAHNNLGLVLFEKRDAEGALAACTKAIKLDPDDARAHSNLGNVLLLKKDLNGAIAAHKKAIELDPRLAVAHSNLGNALLENKNADGAINACKKAIELDPRLAIAHRNLGNALREKKDLEGAIASWRKAIEFDPQDAFTHFKLGTALSEMKDLAGAIAAYRKTFELDPRNVHVANTLGGALFLHGDMDEAIVVYRKVVELDPQSPDPHMMLGFAHVQRGQFQDSLTSMRRFLVLAPANHRQRALVSGLIRACERLQEAERNLPDVLSGKSRPTTAAELTDLGYLCRTYKKRHAAAARFYADAFAADPKSAGDLQEGHRLAAARSAVLAAAGQGIDSAELKDSQRIQSRKQALDWLRAELTAWSKLADDPASRPRVLQTLQYWQKDTELASVRGEVSLTKLPMDERRAWKTFWDDVAALLKKLDPKQ
jgi:tetratricopeptide (TPR) repeat protein/tRNA A-37 threonylcarbamoyl transferase component Bud32